MFLSKTIDRNTADKQERKHIIFQQPEASFSAYFSTRPIPKIEVKFKKSRHATYSSIQYSKHLK
jgi:hypothetical protein